jgi:hypothetical protein
MAVDLVEEALGVEADSAVAVECPAAEVPPEAGNKEQEENYAIHE